MPRSRKRHHSRSRSKSRSRSHSRDRSHDRHKKEHSHEKDGKRRRVDEVDSPLQKRSLSSESHNSSHNEEQRVQEINEQVDTSLDTHCSVGVSVNEKTFEDGKVIASVSGSIIDVHELKVEGTEEEKISGPLLSQKENNLKDNVNSVGEGSALTKSETTPKVTVNIEDCLKLQEDEKKKCSIVKNTPSKEVDEGQEQPGKDDPKSRNQNLFVEISEDALVSNSTGNISMSDDKYNENSISGDASSAQANKSVTDSNEDKRSKDGIPVSDSEDVTVVSDSDPPKLDSKDDKKEKLVTPKKVLTSKQVQKRLESEKKKLQKQKEKEERERQKQEEKAKMIAEKEKARLQKEAERLKLLELKQKEKEQKEQKRKEQEEQKRKEKEEKEQKRQEKEEQEAQKRKEKELEKQKKQQEIEEKMKEKQKEEEKKQKTAALFVGFFKKTEAEEKDRKSEKINCNFMPFEVKSDMRLPPMRRSPLNVEDMSNLDLLIANQDVNVSYLKDLKSGTITLGKTFKTWPYKDPDDEVTIIEEDKILGETIYEDTTTVRKMKAKFLFFHENRRPAYFGTWRKKSKFVKPRKPFGEDTDVFNYEEDSDDDWEEEEQGESLDASGDEEDKEPDNAEDEYEVDNDFFVPHGHLSDDEIDDEENARLSPESLKQKLKLLKDEFDEEIKSKTHKLKPRSIGCIWFNKKGDNVEEAIQRYLQPFAIIVKGKIEIKKRSEIFITSPEKKKLKTVQELPPDHIPFFLKIIHGNVNRKRVVIEQFLSYMGNNGFNVEVTKANLTRFLKQTATYKRCKENGPMKNKFGWFVNEGIDEKYKVTLDLSSKSET